MLRTSGLLSVCCECPTEAGLHRCRRHPMVVKTLVSPNATRVATVYTNALNRRREAIFVNLCTLLLRLSVRSGPTAEACRPRRNPPAAWRGVARAHLPSWPIFHSAPQAGGGLRPTPPGRQRDGKAQSARRGSRRLRLSVRCRAKLCPSARPRGPPPQPRRRPPQVRPGNRRAPTAAHDVAAGAHPRPCERGPHAAWRRRRPPRAAAHGSPQLGAGPRGRRRLGSASSGLKKHREVRLTGSARRMRYTSLLRCILEM